MTVAKTILSGVPLKARILAALLILIPIYYISFHIRSAEPGSLIPYFRQHGSSSSSDFISDLLAHQVSDPFHLPTLSHLCQNRPPRNDVIVSCNPGTGGVGNIRSYILHCTRFAMEAGASMLLPHFTRRSKSDLFELYGDSADFEHFFDREHFISTMESACPHMRVYESEEEGWTRGGMEIPHWSVRINVSTELHPSPWRQEFDAWFEENFSSATKPVIVASGDPGRDRAVMDDGMELYYTIGRILDFRPDARRLAALCMAEISNRFKLDIDPSENIFANSWMGAHLRLDSDAVKAGWNPDFEQQTSWYISQALAHNLTIIYAAGGTDSDIAAFASEAETYGIDVVAKHDLLIDNDLKELKNLLWDQRALVDFEVLLRGSQYGGYARSSFSHNIAFRRRYNSLQTEDPFEASKENHYQDELSVVYGRFDPAWEDEGVRTMWP